MDFPTMFRQALAWHKLSHAKFAKRVGVSAGFISQVAKGHSKPPLDRMEEWAAALSLSDGLEAPFLEAARLAHAPSQLGATLVALRHTKGTADESAQALRIAALESENAALRSRLAEIESLAAPVSRRPPLQIQPRPDVPAQSADTPHETPAQ